MITTIGLGIKFLIKPIEEGHDAESGLEHISKKKITQSMLFGCGIGWICGFTGSGGGILMLTVFTLHLGYNLKVAVGTSTMIMTLVALTGTVSHISMGATVEILPTLNEQYDVAFIDAAKGKYPFFLKESLRMLKPNGVILADNILYKGYVMSDYNKHKQRTAVRNLREYIKEVTEDPNLETEILEVGDGLAVSRRKKID